MLKHQFGLFDFLTFFLTGATLLVSLVAVILINQNPLAILTNNLSSLLIIPFTLISYWLGHILNVFGRVLEKYIFCETNVWLNVYKKHQFKAELEKIGADCFHLDIDKLHELQPYEVGKLYDKGYYKLELEGKLEKPMLLMSQYTFFRSCIALGTCWLIVGFLLTFIISISFQTFTILITLAITSFILISGYLMRSRKRELMKNVYSLIAISN